ncbi:zf-DHHC-domain-containing protein [Myriangium duriaei CBS 260.36]|uniref:Palmitoyltransferase n=1 Tax=Myriangium duriaei CBS 260.36 TaxID=1168546 RepID=A0A9P4MHR8_9PEZI|nr:zf-DHHC-domain-containing protein [Myriangium duriaei CBS 260.36]
MATFKQSNRQPRSSLQSRQRVNKWAAVIVPLIIAGAVGYATWVVVVLVGVHYLLQPGPNTNVAARPGAAGAIIAIYFLLFFLMAAAYFRTLQTARWSPGYVPQGPARDTLRSTFVEEPYVEVEWPCSKPKHSQESDLEKQEDRQGKVPGYYIHTLDMDAIFKGDVAPPPGMEEFYSHDVFQCDPNGLPIWCGTCRNWKPDRVHHCSDNGRCVLKLDHYCPWVGGVVGEANFKFFVQFNIYGMLYTAFILIVMAVFVAEAKRVGTGMVNVPWIIAIALSAMFFFFTSGMAMKSSQDLIRNLTTVDAIDHQRRTVFLAVKLYDGQTGPLQKEGLHDAIPWQGTIAYPFYTRDTPEADRAPRTTFAILCTPPGLNPWNLGPLGNWRDIMGNSWFDWLLPLRKSPCWDHSSKQSMYALGPGFEELLRRAGIESVKRAHRPRRGPRSRSADLESARR